MRKTQRALFHRAIVAAVASAAIASSAWADTVAASSCTTNPGNILDGVSSYGIGEYCYSITCPSGNGFSTYTPYPDRFCNAPGDTIISGWVEIDIHSGTGTPRGYVEIENANNGCGYPHCGVDTETHLYGFNPSANEWELIDTFVTPYGDKTVYSWAGTIVATKYILGRFSGGPTRPDPRWWNFHAEYCNEVYPFSCPWGD